MAGFGFKVAIVIGGFSRYNIIGTVRYDGIVTKRLEI